MAFHPRRVELRQGLRRGQRGIVFTLLMVGQKLKAGLFRVFTTNSVEHSGGSHGLEAPAAADTRYNRVTHGRRKRVCGATATGGPSQSFPRSRGVLKNSYLSKPRRVMESVSKVSSHLRLGTSTQDAQLRTAPHLTAPESTPLRLQLLPGR